MADFKARLDEIEARHDEISTEIDNYDGSFDPEDEATMRRVRNIKAIASRMKEQVEDALAYYNTRADQFNFEPGNVNIDSTVEPGDPRRPNLNG